MLKEKYNDIPIKKDKKMTKNDNGIDCIKL